METTNVKKMVNEQIAETAEEAARLRNAVIHAIEDGIEDARRLAKRGRNIAEDVIDDAEANVRHHPLTSVGIAAAGAFAIGTLVGFLLGRKR
ncbi:MAG TPA: hypothetical protein VMS96_05095 [Terriglobales bacterium]|nr:hypothetical protein [Terriglobales bacterium]